MLVIEDWGQTHYTAALHKQLSYVEKRYNDQIPNTLVFTEHAPVITLGARPKARSSFKVSKEWISAQGIEIISTNRGGEATYHGPGQLVIYPILNIQSDKDLNRYIRKLEYALRVGLKYLNIDSFTSEGKTGVWTHKGKIASIGIAVKQWITYHGCALNLNNTLMPFEYIFPCGLNPTENSMTSAALETGKLLSMAAAKDSLALAFQNTLG